MEATSSTNGVSFQPGQIVGAYKILSLIGKGGAGEGPFIAEANAEWRDQLLVAEARVRRG